MNVETIVVKSYLFHIAFVIAMKKVWSSTKFGKKRFFDILKDLKTEINATTFVSIREAREPRLHAVHGTFIS